MISICGDSKISQPDIAKINDLSGDIHLLAIKGIDFLCEASEASKEIIYSKLKCSMRVIHDRLKDLRITEVRKTIGLDKLLNQVSSENQSSSDWIHQNLHTRSVH